MHHPFTRSPEDPLGQRQASTSQTSPGGLLLALDLFLDSLHERLAPDPPLLPPNPLEQLSQALPELQAANGARMVRRQILRRAGWRAL